MKFENGIWTRKPKGVSTEGDKITVVTEPHTDLWQRTYYGFCNDNAPLYQVETEEEFFSFTVKTHFFGKRRFDQCGVCLYLNGENWIKASVEYENERVARLGSVVTNHGYSDWATTDIPAATDTVWYRLSRRKSDYLIECSFDGVTYRQMRICHLWEGAGKIFFGIYACSPEDSSFTAEFSEAEIGACVWEAHK